MEPVAARTITRTLHASLKRPLVDPYTERGALYLRRCLQQRMRRHGASPDMAAIGVYYQLIQTRHRLHDRPLLDRLAATAKADRPYDRRAQP